MTWRVYEGVLTKMKGETAQLKNRLPKRGKRKARGNRRGGNIVAWACQKEEGGRVPASALPRGMLRLRVLP